MHRLIVVGDFAMRWMGSLVPRVFPKSLSILLIFSYFSAIAVSFVLGVVQLSVIWNSSKILIVLSFVWALIHDINRI
jgi:hypothetical protein